MSSLLHLASEIAVRHVLARHGLTAQHYPGTSSIWWPEPRHTERRHLNGGKCKGLIHWHAWYNRISLGLFFDLRHNRWGLQMEHWYLLADALRRPTYVWLGKGRDLGKLLTVAIPRAAEAHAKFIEPLVLQDAEERLTGRLHPKRGAVAQFLKGMGINDPAEYLTNQPHADWLGWTWKNSPLLLATGFDVSRVDQNLSLL